jgi:hypothetical protein
MIRSWKGIIFQVISENPTKIIAFQHPNRASFEPAVKCMERDSEMGVSVPDRSDFLSDLDLNIQFLFDFSSKTTF